MKIDRSKLLRALEIVKPGLDKNEQLSQSASFAFMDGKVLTYNDVISVSHPVDEINFEAAISAEELYGFLSKLNKPEVDFTVVENELQVKCGRSKVGLRMEELDDTNNRGIKYVIEEERLRDIKKWKSIPDPEIFLKHLRFATQACSKDQTEVTLTCVHVKKDGKIQSTDKNRVIQCVGEPMPVKDFLMPSHSVIDILNINPNKIASNPGWVHFKNDEGTIVSARTPLGDFYTQERLDSVLVLPKGNKIQFPKSIDLMLNRTQGFAKRDFIYDEAVQVIISNGRIEMKATAAKTNSWIEESAKVVTKKDISFWITPTLFTDVLKETKTCLVDRACTKAKFIGTDSNWEYVIVLGQDKED